MDQRLLFIVLCVVIYLYYNNPNSKKIKRKTKNKKTTKDKEHFGYSNNVVQYNEPIENKKEESHEFIQAKFHNDYRDVITALVGIVPTKTRQQNTQLFNISNKPLQYLTPSHDEVDKLVNDFVTYLNELIIKEVTDDRNSNTGWDEATPDKNMDHGYDKFWKNLGIAPIHTNPFPKSPIELVKIASVDKYETDEQIKYAVKFAIQKKLVDDIALLNVSFVVPNFDNMSDEDSVDMNVYTESAEFEGYYRKASYFGKTEYNNDDFGYQNFKPFDTEMEKNDMMDPNVAQDELHDYYSRLAEKRSFRHNQQLDKLHIEYNNELPDLSSYESYRVKNNSDKYNEFHGRTIFDDQID
jgi:hypothetical protein